MPLSTSSEPSSTLLDQRDQAQPKSAEVQSNIVATYLQLPMPYCQVPALAATYDLGSTSAITSSRFKLFEVKAFLEGFGIYRRRRGVESRESTQNARCFAADHGSLNDGAILSSSSTVNNLDHFSPSHLFSAYWALTQPLRSLRRDLASGCRSHSDILSKLCKSENR